VRPIMQPGCRSDAATSSRPSMTFVAWRLSCQSASHAGEPVVDKMREGQACFLSRSPEGVNCRAT
jgi:hypothetical protein